MDDAGILWGVDYINKKYHDLPKWKDAIFGDIIQSIQFTQTLYTTNNYQMAKTKSPSIEEIIDILPSLTHEDFMKLKEEVESEHKKRKDKTENDFKLLQNGSKQ